MKIQAVSVERFSIGVRGKRLYGSSTATVFVVSCEGKQDVWVTSYGKTPGDRKTLAIGKAQEVWAGMVGTAEKGPIGIMDNNGPRNTYTAKPKV